MSEPSTATTEPPKEPFEPRLDARKGALILLAVLAAGYVFTQLGPVLRPFLVAVFVYYMTRSFVKVLARRGVPKWAGYTLLLALVVTAVTVISSLAYREASNFVANWHKHQEEMASAVGQVTGTSETSLQRAIQSSIEGSVGDTVGSTLEFVIKSGVMTAELLLMAFFYLIFLVIGAHKFQQRVRQAFPGEAGDYFLRVSHQVNEGMEEFLRVKSTVSIGLAVTTAIVMYLFGLKQWLLWGVAFFLLNFVTYFGSMVALVPPIAIGLAELPSRWQAVAMGVVLVLVRLFWIDYAEIKMSGRKLNFDPALLLLWVAYWGWQWGVVGLILSFPMATALKIILENLAPTREVALLISDGDGESSSLPHACGK